MPFNTCQATASGSVLGFCECLEVLACFLPVPTIKRSSDNPDPPGVCGLAGLNVKARGNLLIHDLCLFLFLKELLQLCSFRALSAGEEPVVRYIPPFPKDLKSQALLLEDADDPLVCSCRKRLYQFLKN